MGCLLAKVMGRWKFKASQAFLRKCPAGMGFKIFFELQGSVLVRESAIPDQFPRFELCGVCGPSGVVLQDTALQICVAPMYSCSGELTLRMM
jgi:hypothetical protein